MMEISIWLLAPEAPCLTWQFRVEELEVEEFRGESLLKYLAQAGVEKLSFYPKLQALSKGQEVKLCFTIRKLD